VEHCVHFDVRAAEHEVRVHARDVHAVDHAALDRFGVGAAVGHVARRVLVEQRLVEDPPGLSNARRAVDQRDLAEIRSVVVACELALDHARPFVGAHADDAAVLEPHLEPLHDLPGEHERLRRAREALRPAAVGSGEDLFRRHVRDVRDAQDGARLTPLPA
jgi:hypothetical protein